MRRLLTFIASLLLCAEAAQADILTNSLEVLSVAGGTSSASGNVVHIPSSSENGVRSFTCRATASNVSGSSPTLDLKIQKCRTTDSATCVDFCVFARCGSGACWTSGYTTIDGYNEPIYPYLRGVATIGGSSPSYNYSLHLDY